MKSEVAVIRRKNHGSQRRCAEWTRRPGASPPMRMTASWHRSSRIDRIQGCGAISAPASELLLGSRRARSSGCEKDSIYQRRRDKIEIHRGSNSGGWRLYVAATIMMARSAHSRSSPAPSARRTRLRGLTAQRSRAREQPLPQCNRVTWQN